MEKGGEVLRELKKPKGTGRNHKGAKRLAEELKIGRSKRGEVWREE